MPAASEAAEKLKDARKAEVQTGSHPAAEAERRKVKEEQEAEFHTPATAMLDSLQPFNVEGGEGLIHQMKARQARTAAQEAVKDAGRHLLNVADPRPLIRDHPWMAIGGSAAGFPIQRRDFVRSDPLCRRSTPSALHRRPGPFVRDGRLATGSRARSNTAAACPSASVTTFRQWWIP